MTRTSSYKIILKRTEFELQTNILKEYKKLRTAKFIAKQPKTARNVNESAKLKKIYLNLS